MAIILYLSIVSVLGILAIVNWLIKGPAILTYLITLICILTTQSFFGGLLVQVFGRQASEYASDFVAMSLGNKLRAVARSLPVWVCASIVYLHTFTVTWYLLAQALRDNRGVQNSKRAMQLALYQGSAVFVALLIFSVVLEVVYS